jgi:hypothetical protein
MDHDTKEQRNLRSLAVRLRRLASVMLSQRDRSLYQLTAEALEKHSAGPVSTPASPERDPKLYRPVDLIV